MTFSAPGIKDEVIEVPNVVCYKERCPYSRWKEHHDHRCSRKTVSLDENGVCEVEKEVKAGSIVP